MILTLIFLPLINTIFCGLFSRYFKNKLICNFTTVIMFLNVTITVFLFFRILTTNEYYFINLGSWIYSGQLHVNWNFCIDTLVVVMLLVINSISTMVHLYSLDYMEYDAHITRFVAYLSLFTFFMILLITGDNFVILFLGWEGVGLCSYLLINFWYTRIQANKAAIKAMIVNRIADIGLTIAIVILWKLFKSVDFNVIFSIIPFFVNTKSYLLGMEINIIKLICVMLLLGAMGKSAQIGLHTWLPDAMEGPTPVSALIHAATMVTAGVFLIIKCSPFFENVPELLTTIIFIGALTSFFSATVGLIQNDIKKVIAYSTCSQLGYMIFTCGLSNYNISFFHLTNHAFFKALLFLSAGAIIHNLSNEQDMRKMGGLLPLLPFTATMMLIGSLALIGFPFLTGFYSKDLILEIALMKYTLPSTFAYLFGILTAFLTAFYTYRLFYMTFIYKTNSFRQNIIYAVEVPGKIAFSLLVLSFGSIFFGYLCKDMFTGLGNDFWNGNIFILPKNNNLLDAEFFGWVIENTKNIGVFNNITYFSSMIKNLPFIFSIIALYFVLFIFSNTKYFIKKHTTISFRILINNKKVYKFLINKWCFDIIYNDIFIKFILKQAHYRIFTLIDRGLLEFLGPFGITNFIKYLSIFVRKLQTGYAYEYAYVMFWLLIINFIMIDFFFHK